jgi:hypothetical protein
VRLGPDESEVGSQGAQETIRRAMIDNLWEANYSKIMLAKEWILSEGNLMSRVLSTIRSREDSRES